MRLTLAFVFLSSLTMGEKFDVNVPQKEEEQLLSKELSEDEEASSDLSTEMIESDSNLPGMGLRGSYFTDDSALQHVDQQHRVTGIKFKPVPEGQIGAQEVCNVLAQDKFFEKAGIHNKVRIGPVVFSKTFRGQTVDIEANAVGEKRINANDNLVVKTASNPLRLVTTEKQVFVHKKCKDGKCGLLVRTKGVAHKGEGLTSFYFPRKQKKVMVKVHSEGTKQLTMVCYDANGKIIGEKDGGRINGNGDTRLIVESAIRDIKGCSIYPIGSQGHFTRKQGIVSVCVDED